MSHRPSAQPSVRIAFLFWLLLAMLLAVRLPSLVQPAGGDQGLYAYTATRVLAGDVPYRDTWDQKPPGIAYLYALLLRAWPHQSVVALGDLAAAAATAWLLILLFRRHGAPRVGWIAALVFLLFGDPALHRLSGVYVRGQCEPYIALVVTAALVLLAARTRHRWHFFGAGVCLAMAFWLKYNAVAYALPIAMAAWAWRLDSPGTRTSRQTDFVAIALGFAIPTIVCVGYFAWQGVLGDLRLATIDYNILYSNETYDGTRSVTTYLLTLPIARARTDMLWFLGGVGTLVLVWRIKSSPLALVILSWLTAAVLSVAINGQRDLPNYFVQAGPALAATAAAGGAIAFSRKGGLRLAAIIAIFLGLWRVGDEDSVLGLRWGGIPGIVENLRYDLAYWRGQLDRSTYLARFKGPKFDALEIDTLSRYIRQTTRREDPVFVFGFLGGSVCWQSERVSASRFFWSRPVIIEFAAGAPGYGSSGLLADLRQRAPVVVALQKEQWQSEAFFLANQPLRAWLEEGYVVDHSSAMFTVWRRKVAPPNAVFGTPALPGG